MGASYAGRRRHFREEAGLSRRQFAGSPECSIVLLNAETVLGEVMSDAGAGQNPVEQPEEGRNSRNGARQYAEPEHEAIPPCNTDLAKSGDKLTRRNSRRQGSNCQ